MSSLSIPIVSRLFAPRCTKTFSSAAGTRTVSLAKPFAAVQRRVWSTPAGLGQDVSDVGLVTLPVLVIDLLDDLGQVVAADDPLLLQHPEQHGDIQA